MRKLASAVALVVGGIFSVATSTPHDVYKPDTGALDTGEPTRDPDESEAWSADADLVLDACTSADVAVTAWLSGGCLATPTSGSWSYPVGSVDITWYVNLPGDTSTDTSTEPSSTDTSDWDDGGGPSYLGDTGVTDTGISDTGIGDTGISDTGIGDTGISDTGISDTGISDTGITDTGADTGSCVASSDGARVHLYVRDAAGEVVFEDIDTVAIGDPMTGSFEADPAFRDCEADTACTRGWTVSFVIEEGGPVEASVEGALALSACSSGDSDRASGDMTVE